MQNMFVALFLVGICLFYDVTFCSIVLGDFKTCVISIAPPIDNRTQQFMLTLLKSFRFQYLFQRQ